MTRSWEQVFADELKSWLDPVLRTEGDPERVLDLFASAGWFIDRLPLGNQGTLREIVAEMSQGGKDLVEVLGAPPPKLEDFLIQVGQRMLPIVVSLVRLTEGLPANLPGNIDELPADLLSWLTVHWLRTRHRRAYEALRVLGIIRQLDTSSEVLNGAVYRIKGATPQLVPAAVLRLVTRPQDALVETWWPTGFADGGAGAFALALQLYAFVDSLGVLPDLTTMLSADGIDPDDAIAAVAGNTLTLKRQVILADGATADAGVVLELIPPAAGGLGVQATPYGQAQFAFTMGRIRASLSGTLAANPIRIVPAGVSQVAADKPNFGAMLTLTTGTADAPALHVGDPEGLELTLETVSALAGLELPPGRPRALLGVDLKAFRFSLSAAEGDGFLAAILPPEGIKGNASLAVEYSSDGGLAVRGGGGLTIAIPTHIELGPIQIQQLLLSISLSNDQIPIELSASIGAMLGPLSLAVERMGVLARLSMPDGGGSLGPFDVKLGFKPPNGVGLAINAGAVAGGGYLYFDFDKEEYAGALELVFSGFITLTAVGLVTTRMPDGSKGFSLLIIITAEFGTGIQLGFGFTLIGVGGLLGLNRTVKLQPLADGVRTGAVNNIMFPRNVVANAPRIISDLRAIFPPYEGRFLIGPMAKLGWGSPPLITLSLGIIIEIPGNLAILGVLKCILPTEEAPVLKLQVAFVGAIEFDKKRLWLFAGIFDSRILTFTLEGEMGVLFAWGDDADFVLSVGGFHPRFKPPPLPFPSPKRLAISILDQSNARIRVSTYFAVTTNTVQFGAKAELYFGFSGLSVEGDFSFDALFQFSPFYFIIELGAHVSLKIGGMGVFGISLDLALEGPTPWHARGRGSISFFFFDVSASFDKTWGQEKDTRLPPIDVFPILAAELEKEQNWSALPPKGRNLLVALRVVGETKEFVLHPVGTLRITQRAVPLNSTIDLFGAQDPADARRFALAVKSAGMAVDKMRREDFAPAQFHKMSRNEKLAAPAFSKEDGGADVTAAGDQLRSSLVARRIVRYEEVTIDTNYKRFKKRFADFKGRLFSHFLAGNAAARSALSASIRNQLQPFDDAIAVRPEGFGVAWASTNGMVQGTTMFASYHAAKEHLDNAVAADPALAGTIHVVHGFEINPAA